MSFLINGEPWVPPSEAEIARQLADYTRRVEECQLAVGMTAAEIAALDAGADRVRARDRLWHTPPELCTPEMYAAAGLPYDDPENEGEEDAGDDWLGAMLPSDFRVWRERLGWNQTDAAAALDLSRRTIVGYESGGQPIPRAIVLACWALTQHHGR